MRAGSRIETMRLVRLSEKGPGGNDQNETRIKRLVFLKPKIATWEFCRRRTPRRAELHHTKYVGARAYGHFPTGNLIAA